jgi:histidinol-phosphatase (PHP family)
MAVPAAAVARVGDATAPGPGAATHGTRTRGGDARHPDPGRRRHGTRTRSLSHSTDLSGTLRQMPIALPLDAHLHTDLSPDANVPLDAYAALAREQGLAELAVTDHIDFVAGDPAFRYAAYDQRARLVHDAAERWAGEPAIRLGLEVTYEQGVQGEIAAYLSRHAYDYVIGSVHMSSRGPFRNPATAAAWCAGRTPREATAFYFEEVERAIRSGLFDTIGHLDFVKRYIHPYLGAFEYEPHADIYDRLLHALIETGTALEVNASGLRQEPGEPYPAPVVVGRFRELGGERIVAGSDAHRIEHFAFGLPDVYRTIGRAGFRELAFRRGGGREAVELSTELVTALLGARGAGEGRLRDNPPDVRVEGDDA